MTPDQIRLVRQSFATIADERALAQAFYTRLFALEPSVRPLFPADLDAQGAKLMAVLRVVIAGLDDLRPLMPTVERLAVRHVGYGVAERQYPTVGLALVDALQQALGAAFTADMRAGWVAAYGALSTAMIAAARAAAYPPIAAISAATLAGVNGFSA